MPKLGPSETVTADLRGVGHAETITADQQLPDASEGLFAEDWAVGGRYALVAELARGGGGKIAVAIDRKLGRKVALKRALDTDGDSRLEREALVLARLEHPAIVPIHDAGYDAEGSPFYTMKLVGGQNLARRIESAETFEARLGLLPAITTVADAMAYAHSQRVIHRDLKPGNVLVGEFGEVAVIDWGLGKVLGESELASRDTPLPVAQLTVDGSVMGTPAYMAPEQARSPAVDERADVYAIGAMLYHALTGAVPYGNVSGEVTLTRLLENAPTPVDEREPRVPRELAAIVGKAMARAPEDRYATAKELAEDLHRYQTGRLVAAHRYRLHTRAWKWVRRHQTKLAIGAGVIAVAVAVVTLAMSQPVVDETCRGLDQTVNAAWSPSVRAQLETAFEASKLPFAPALARDIVGRLDRHAAAIKDMRVAACRSGRVTKEQSEAVMASRMECLDRRVSELGELASALAHADAKTIARAAQTTSDVLGRVEDCADLALLRDVTPLPADPIRRAEVLAVQRDLDRMSVLAGENKVAEWIALAPTVAERAARTDHGPTIARARVRYAEALTSEGKDDLGEQQLREAVAAADRAHADVERARALLEWLHVEIDHRYRDSFARLLVDLAQAAAERSRDPVLMSRSLVYRAHISEFDGDFASMVTYAEQAVALLRDVGGIDLLQTRRALGEHLILAGRIPEAEKLLHGAIDDLTRQYGAVETPEIAALWGDLANAAYARGDFQAAVTLAEREVAMDDHMRDINATNWIKARMNLATMKHAALRNEEAERELEATLADSDARLGRQAGIGVEIAFNLGITREGLNKMLAAADAYRDGIARAELINPHGEMLARCRAELGSVYLDTDRPKEALEVLGPALDYHVERGTPDSPVAAVARADLGRAYVGIGRFEAARTELARALPVIDRGNDTYAKADYRINLAKAEWQLGDRARARELATEARHLIAEDGQEGAFLAEELAAWEKSR